MAQVADEAREMSVLETDPDHKTGDNAAEKAKEEGNALFAKKDFKGALEKYTQAIELAPHEHTYYGNRSAAYFQLQRYGDALRDAQKAFSMNQAFTKGYIRAAHCLIHLGRFDDARSTLQQTGKSGSPSIASELRQVEELQAKLQKAKDLLSSNPHVAQRLFKELTENHATASIDIQLLFVQALINAKNFQDALPICEKLYREHHDTPDVLAYRGLVLYYSGNVALALKHFQALLQMDPDHKKGQTWYKMIKKLDAKKKDGNTFYQEGKTAEAVQAFTEALALDPVNDTFNSQLYCNRAAAQLKAREYKSAIEDCSKAIDLNPQYTKAFTRRAEAYSKMEDWEEAVRDYEKVMKLEPDNEEVPPKLRKAKLELKKSKRKDYYKILDVPKHADESEIKKAYRRAALRWHPDKNQGSDEEKTKAEAMFKDIGEAYSVLNDAKLRRRYDSGADVEEDQEFSHASHMDMSDLMQMFMSQGGGGFGFGGFSGGGHRGSRHGFG